MMILLNDLIEGTAVGVPAHIQRLFDLVEESLMLEGSLEDLPRDNQRADELWEKAAGRTVDALDAALQAHNDAEVMIVCGS